MGTAPRGVRKWLVELDCGRVNMGIGARGVREKFVESEAELEVCGEDGVDVDVVIQPNGVYVPYGTGVRLAELC